MGTSVALEASAPAAQQPLAQQVAQQDSETMTSKATSAAAVVLGVDDHQEQVPFLQSEQSASQSYAHHQAAGISHADQTASVSSAQQLDNGPATSSRAVPDSNHPNDRMMEERTEYHPHHDDIVREPKAEHEDVVERLLREASYGHMQFGDEVDDMEIEEEDLIQILDGDVWKTVAPGGAVIEPEVSDENDSRGSSIVASGTGWSEANGMLGAPVANGTLPTLSQRNSLSWGAPVRPSLRNRVSAADLNHTYAPSFVTESPGNWTLEFGDTDDSETEEDEESGDDQAAVSTAAAAVLKDSAAAELAKRRKELEDKMKEFQRRIAEKEKAKNGGQIVRPATPVGLSKGAGSSGTSGINGVAPRPSPDIAAEVAQNLERRKQLVAEIAESEQELSAAQRTVTEDEADIVNLRQRAAVNDAMMTALETDLGEIQARMEELRERMEVKKAEVVEVRKTGTEIANDMAAKKKQLIVDGKKVADIQGNINAKRIQLVELVKAAKEKANAKRSVGDASGSPHKRRKTTEGGEARLALRPPTDGDFIELPAEDEMGPRGKNGISRRGREEVERALQEFIWVSAETTVYIMNLSGFAVDDCVCTPSFLREAGFPMIEGWSTDGDSDGSGKQVRQCCSGNFDPRRLISRVT